MDYAYIIPAEPNIFFYPKCLPVKRCGYPCGCSYGDIINLQCVATKTELLQANVLVYNYLGKSDSKILKIYPKIFKIGLPANFDKK